MVTLRQPLKNKNLLEANQPELCKTTLKYRNLFGLTSKILGSYMRVCIGNSMICCDIWHKYHKGYFEIVICNLASR